MSGASYYSRAISVPSPSTTRQSRRPRSGSVERPLNTRLYRTAWLVVLVPVLLAAFTITRPAPLPRSATSLEPGFDVSAAAGLARELATLYPDRAPGSPSSPGAARWVQQRLAALGLTTEIDRFTAAIPGRGETELRNVLAVVPGRSLDTIAVTAHRDSTAGEAGLVDNASGTGALIELARAYSATRTGVEAGVSPNHTLAFVSTDAGAYGLLGARQLARSDRTGRIVAVVSLDDVASPGRPSIEIAGRGPRSPSPELLATATARLREQRGEEPHTASVLGQLIDLAVPLSLTEQLELLSAGIPSLAVTSGGGGNESGLRERLDTASLGQIGRATESLVSSLDERLAPPGSTRAYLHARGRLVQGWAIAVLYAALAVPFLLALVDLVIRLRRRGIALRPALRSYLRRLGFWLWAGALFLLFGLAGAWPDGDAAAISPASQAADHWPRLGLALYGLALAGSWLVARRRLARRGPVAPEDELAGSVASLIALAVLVLVTIATNTYALLLLLPSAHAWLFLVQAGGRRASQPVLYAVGFAGAAMLLGSLAVRFELGLDAPWYLAELTAIDYVPKVGFALSLAWLAVASQLFAVVTGRYAAYPGRGNRPLNIVAAAIVSFRGERRRGHDSRQEPA